nr:immunoglobulin light chain junction region [Macaca mulatta]
CQQYNGNPLTF